MVYRRNECRTIGPDTIRAGRPGDALRDVERIEATEHIPAISKPFFAALKKIIRGSRDRSLASVPEMKYEFSGEIILLIDALEELQVPAQDKTAPHPG